MQIFIKQNKKHQTKQYAQSFKAFKQLAEQGNSNAQMALAESYALGQGTQVDLPLALAWSLVAKDNQHPTADHFYSIYRSEVKSRRQVKQLYRQLKQQFGHQTLQQTLYPILNDLEQPLVKSIAAIEVSEPQYPIAAFESKQQQFVLAMYDIDGNGQSNNIRILLSYPNQNLDAMVKQTIDSWRFSSSFDPFNNPIEHHNQLQLMQLFGEKNQFAQSKQAQQIKRMANQGIAEQQYLYALLLEANLISTTTSSQQAALDWLTRAAVNGHIPAQYHLSLCLKHNSRCKQQPNKAQTWFNQTLKTEEKPTRITMAYIKQLINQDKQSQALIALKPLIDSNHLPALILQANLLAQKTDAKQTELEQAIKIARQAMALDHDNPQLLAILANAHYRLNPNTSIDNKPQWQQLLTTAIAEAEYRQWPIDYYVELLEQYQLATLNQQLPKKSAKKP